MILNRSIQSNTHSFRADIQGLRAIAVLSVILFHLDFSLFEGGFIGVDIFFAISGFLMAQVISRDLQSGNFSFSSFYMRRIRRILPALYTTLAFTIIASWFVLFPKNFVDFTDALAGSILFLANAILMNQSSGYFAETLTNHPLLHMWSLSIEEQFYLFFPLLFLALYRFTVATQLIFLLLLSVASLTLAEYYFSISPSATFFHLPGRVFEFLIGVAAFRSKYIVDAYLNKTQLTALNFVGLVFILGSILLFKESVPVPSAWVLVPLIGCFLVLSCEIEEGWFNLVLSNKFLVFLGGISFSLYLIHQPVLALARYQGFDSRLMLTGLIMLVVLPLAYLQYRFIESSLRNKNRFSDKFLITFVFLGGLFFLSFAYVTKLKGGFPARFGGGLLSALETSIGSPLRDRCTYDRDSFRKLRLDCSYFGGPSLFAVLGDSHSVALSYALAQAVEVRMGRSITQYSFSGCSSPMGSSERDPCRSWTNSVLEQIKESPSVRYVVLSYRLQSALHGKHREIFPLIPNEKSEIHTAETWRSLIDLMSIIESMNKTVIWVRQPPEVGEPMNDLFHSLSQTIKDASSVSLDWWELRRAWSNEHMHMIPDSVIVVDPAKLLCDQRKCNAIIGNTSMYRDQDHLSLSGASLIVNELLNIVKKDEMR